MTALFVGACANPKSPETETVLPACPSVSGTAYSISGQITYDWVPAVYSGGISRLDYTQKTAKPARRVIVQAVLTGCSGTNVVASTTTNDDGTYTLSVPSGAAVKVRALAQLLATNYTPDSTSPNNCNGSSWDIRVVDNTANRALYAVDSATTYSAAASGVNVNASLSWSTSPWKYTSRSAAPFAILDTIVSELELVCQGASNISFPLLYVNWSEKNTNASGDYAAGNIGTSFFTTMNYGNALYILGKENVDTDEYDDHVIAHEFGHYVENTIFRADTIGGMHSFGVSLDPRVAFSEGWGNAVSGMVFGNPLYVDTNGSNSTFSSGIAFNVSTAPSSADDRAPYSERSVQYLLYKLWDNRNGTSNSGLLDRIFQTWLSVKASASFTSVQTFASYYNQLYGATAESFRTLWETNLDLPYNALCPGTCSGSGDTADPYDTQNLIGAWFATSGHYRHYPQGTGSTFGAEFWRLYRPLSSGLNSGTAHDQTNDGGYGAYAGNRFGFVRWYTYTGTGVSTTIAVESPSGWSCTTDVLDIVVQKSGTVVKYDIAGSGATAGCPSVTFTAQNGVVYTIEVRGVENVSSYNVRVTP
jgi:hypothetical protein